MFVSRAGDKLEFALKHFAIDVSDLVCADLGCSTGGFTDCLLAHGASKVYAVDTGYGVLAWKLRRDPRVHVLERTNALHVHLTEPPQFISIDVSWTPQRLILPSALSLLAPRGQIVSLVKPHYESQTAHLEPAKSQEVVQNVIAHLERSGIKTSGYVKSPLLGEKGHNVEYFLWLKK